MWLGDLDELSPRDLKILAAHNLDSDHDIGSEFYAAEIDIEFTPLSQEQRLIRAQGKFAELLANRGLKLLRMEAEAVSLMRNFKRPIHFSDDELGSRAETMTKLFIERIEVDALKTNIPASAFAKGTRDKLGGG